MRIRHITLERFRGVDAATIGFASGVTVVEGPNEAGKSTISEAISLLFDHRDSSRRQEVRAAQQIGSDIGPYVELEFSVGEYDVTYAKRFLRRPSTTLSIAAPHHEQISGREAHDRMITICKETLDDALWSAMRVAQGGSLDQPDLADVGVLRAALDESESADGESDLDLLGRVADEYARYFTPRTGQPTGELSEAVAAQVAAQETYDRVVAELDAAEADVQRSAAIDAELDGLSQESAGHGSRLAELRRRSRALESLRTAHADAVGALETATSRLSVAGDAVAERATMVAEATERAETAQRIDDELVRLRAEADAARADADRAREAATAARDEARAGERAFRRATEHAQAKRLEHESAALDKRLDRAAEARDAILAADTTIGAARIDDAALERLVELQTATRTTREVQRLNAATLEVESLGTAGVDIRGAEPDDDGTWAVVEPTTVEVPGVVRMTVKPGRADLDADVSEADRALESALDEAGEPSVDAARDALARVREAHTARELAQARLRDALGDAIDYDALAAAAASVRQRLDGLRDRLGEFAESIEQADEDVARAGDAYDTASASVDAEEHEAGRYEAEAAALREALAKSEQQRESARAELRRIEQRLADARERTTDADLDTEVELARAAVEEAQTDRDRAERELAEARPDEVATLLANAEAVEERIARARREYEDEKQQIAGKLEATASRGLYDQADDAAAALEHTEGVLSRVERRADAARLLYDTLRRHRDTARRRYVAPFRAAIERLGSIVFGADLAVEVSDDLRIVSRTIAGRTVAFDALSGGAREQLAILGRLAAASLVEPVDGVPLVLDDALGHADPSRLERLAAVLNQAGREMQIIILTCHPERFRSVGSAETVRLGY